MKNISILFISSLFLFSFSQSNAQLRFVLNGGTQIPVSDFKNTNDLGYGGSLDIEFKLPMIGTTIFATAGYDRWKRTNTNYSNYAIPVMGGIKYFISTSGNIVSPYISAAVGITSVGNNIENSSTESNFIWSPSIGVRISNFDFNAKFMSYSTNGITISWFGINAGAVLGR